MIRKTIEVKGVRAVITGRTNRSEAMSKIVGAVLVEQNKGLAELAGELAKQDEKTLLTPRQNAYLEPYANFIAVCSQIESIIGVDFELPDIGSSTADIARAYDDYLDGDPDVWREVVAQIRALDKPLTPPEEAPFETLTKEQQNDPNSLQPALDSRPG